MALSEHFHDAEDYYRRPLHGEPCDHRSFTLGFASSGQDFYGDSEVLVFFWPKSRRGNQRDPTVIRLDGSGLR